MKVQEICDVLEQFAPLSLQESYDNSGLQIGDRNAEVTSILLCTDVTEKIIKEAVDKCCNMIVAHHPLLFKPIKHLTSSNYVERCVVFAVKNNIAVYAGHTNVDKVKNGVSYRMAQKLGLENVGLLVPEVHQLLKLVTFVPKQHLNRVKDALFNAGAGNIGNYDSCSFASEGIGSFRANSQARPFVGELDELHFEDEVRVEVILPKNIKNRVVKALLNAHPYEEPAYDLFILENTNSNVGLGVIGYLNQPMEESIFFDLLKSTFEVKAIKHSPFLNRPIRKVALCGGSCSSLISDAASSGADIIVTADINYHQFFNHENKLVIADIGHYESEYYTKEIFYEQLIKKIPKFAIQFAQTETNPVEVY